MSERLTRTPSARPTREAQRLLDLLNALGSTTFRQFLWQRSSELDLTYAQSQVLFHVADHRECPMGDVAKTFGVTLPAVTHIVDRLEQKGLLARGDHPTDRRVCVLGLTRRGEALVRELHVMRLSALEGVLAPMSASDRERVLSGLETLVEAATRAAADGERRPAAGRRTS
jgi:DNA-binding MarR family transcriptional regulator